MKILISGAGIAGLSLAYWLKHYGFEPTIVERAPALLVGGYKLDIRGSALEVIRRMGVYEKLKQLNTNMQNAILVNKQGKTIEEMDGEAFGHRSGDDIEVVREGICRTFYDHLSGIDIWFDDVIEAVEQTDTHVEVSFKHRNKQSFDLVIGADGLHSTVRHLVFGEESQWLHDLGVYLCVYNAPNYLHLNNQEMQFTEIGRVAQVWSTGDNQQMKACFGFVSKEKAIPLKDRKAHEQRLNQAFHGIDWVMPKLLSYQTTGDDYYFDKAAQVKMPSFSKGRVTLVGDAGYCASPLSGQGTSLAIIGAYILAGELAREKDNFAAAFMTYEDVMKPFIESNQRLGQQAANMMNSQGFISQVIGNFIQKALKYAPGKLVRWIINMSTKRIQTVANSIQIKDYP
ncbi:FAD-dependent monooxygenase [Legionella sp. W05-934-2]|jgi:2-polyprenyl-6-methoxyphenol hydroxylase-like FAD-dependent oxidoreductase|uniref:FAD-dependent monooxygenase n=1 Tax=Legionella sp. W05-934-2 TaxID=1198649 RepID=UPI003461AF86